jgi:hypothetical protein
MDVVQPNDRKAFTRERMKPVADYDFTREMLTGSMSPSCSRH